MSNKHEIDLEDRERFLPNDPSSLQFSANSNSANKLNLEENKQSGFNGLTKEQIIQYADDPKWVRIRWILFALFWVLWIGMLVAAILIVVFTPKCAPRPKQNFWDKEVVYQVDVEKFKDSDGDFKGDLKGLANEIGYFDSIGVKSLLLGSNLLNENAQVKENLVGGGQNSIEFLKSLRTKLTEKDMHLLIDFPIGLYETKKEAFSNWLKDYADGVRVILDNNSEKNSTSITSIIEQTNKVAKETFKPKFIAFYPNEDTQKGQSTLIRSTLLDIDNETLSSAPKLIEKIKDLYKNSDNPAILLGQFGSESSPSKRVSDSHDQSASFFLHSMSLLIKGTPFILYGDEIGLTNTDNYMKWDSGLNCGFSDKNNSEIKIDCTENVKIKLARGENLPRNYKKISELRKEPSFSWGEIKYSSTAQEDHLVSFVRVAPGFDGYLVVANTGQVNSAVDLKSKYSKVLGDDLATVEFFYTSYPAYKKDFELKESVRLDNIYLKPGELLVLKFPKLI